MGLLRTERMHEKMYKMREHRVKKRETYLEMRRGKEGISLGVPVTETGSRERVGE